MKGGIGVLRGWFMDGWRGRDLPGLCVQVMTEGHRKIWAGVGGSVGAVDESKRRK